MPRDEHGRPKQRQRDRHEAAQGAGAVDPRGLVQRGVDALQAGEQQNRDERRRLPDVGERRSAPRPRPGARTSRTTATVSADDRAAAVGTPAWASNMNRQISAATTVGIAHGSSAASANQATAARGSVHQQREREPERELQR